METYDWLISMSITLVIFVFRMCVRIEWLSWFVLWLWHGLDYLLMSVIVSVKLCYLFSFSFSRTDEFLLTCFSIVKKSSQAGTCWIVMPKFVCWSIILNMYVVAFVGSLNLLVPSWRCIMMKHVFEYVNDVDTSYCCRTNE